VTQTCEEKGKYAIAYHSDMSKYGPKAHLTATTHHWGEYYTRTMNDVIAGKWKPTSIWGGMKEGMIKLAPLNAAVPADVKSQVAAVENDIKSGKLHPFAGPVKDQDGKERVAAGKSLSDDELGKMDYYVEGVAGKLPSK
jgi:simple sugar transport system substrate-binding protein